MLYVTDLLDIGSSEVGISKTKEFLMTTFAMKDLGDVSLIVGMHVSCDRLKGTLDIKQGNYANAILQRYGFVDSRSVSTRGTGTPWTSNSEFCWTVAKSSYTNKLWEVPSIYLPVHAGTLLTP